MTVFANVQPEAPRWPGPKTAIKFQATIPNNTEAEVVLNNSSGTVYVIGGIDVNATSSGVGAEYFQLWLGQPPNNLLNMLVMVGQVSSQTGLYFPWRGVLELYPSEQLTIQSVSGGWSCFAWGFSTSLSTFT